MGDGAPAGGAISNMTPRGELEEGWKLNRLLEEAKELEVLISLPELFKLSHLLYCITYC